MNKTLERIHEIGKFANVIITIVVILGLISSFITIILSLYLFSIKDVEIKTDSNMTMKIELDGMLNKLDFSFLSDGYTYDLDYFTLKDFIVNRQDDKCIITAKANNNGNLSMNAISWSFLYSGLKMLAESICLILFKKICKYTSKCESLFTDDLIKMMNDFMYSILMPFSLSLFAYLFKNYLPFKNTQIPADYIIGMAIIYFITYIFKYGTKLQIESDETL